MTFVPKKPKPLWEDVPFFEQSRAYGIDGRETEKSIERLKGEICEWLGKVGATGMYFVDGEYQAGSLRHGWRIYFTMSGIPGRIDCAALPVQNETEQKIQKAQKQALYLLRDELKAAYFAALHKPGSVPLIPYLMVGPEEQTVTELLVKSGKFPALGTGE